jgi:ribosomal protein L7Ae-like RNA K-turn-binding protein
MTQAEIKTKKLNPCELQIDLFCKGIKIHETCTLESDARLFARTRAGLGSGLELILPGDLKDIWMNAPVEEDFVQNTCYYLKKSGSDYVVFDDRNDYEYKVKIPNEPNWYLNKTSKGNLMSKIGVLQGTYLGIYLSKSCEYWYDAPKRNCKFCTTGFNVGINEAESKDIDEVVEVAQAAKEESGITFVHFNTGYQLGKGLNICAPYVKAIKERVGLMVGIQAIPAVKEELWKYDWLIDCGADHFSFCYEFHSPEVFAELCPGKEETITQQAFFDALEYTQGKMQKGQCSGEIIAGVEPLEWTYKAIDYITDVGAFPTVCIFRPVIGADLENLPSPKYEDMIPVMKHMYLKCREHKIPIGAAPNVEVSLIVQPDDAKYLVPRDMSFHAFQAYINTAKTMGAFMKFNKELKPHPVPGDPYNPPVAE